MAENTREIVLDALLEMERNKVYSHKLLKAVLDKYDYLSVQDKRFMKRLAEGCIERKLELDYYLDHFSTVPVNKMKPLIRCLMRMGVYQIVYMDSVPASAACNECVKLAAKRKFTNLKGFVNGVLRKIAANIEDLPLPEEKDTEHYLSVKYSMPLWLVQMWLKDYSKETVVTFLEGMMRVHPVSIRFRTDLSVQEKEAYINQWQESGANVKALEDLPYMYTLEGVEGVAALKGFSEGVFTVQDISSAMSVEAAGIGPQDVCMDICAAPGGKTLLAAEKAAKVISRDVSEYKAEFIRENCNRMQLTDKVEVQVWDATVLDEAYIEKADVVLMDVPCSGLGVLGKKRDIKYNVTPESMESLMQLQKQIVNSSWQYVKKGGTLLYSTCTIHKEENEMMSKWICENYPFVLEEEKQILPGFREADGFYYARLRRIDGE